LNNINLLSELSFNGIAVISGIMSSADIPSSTKNYINELNKITKHAN
jgi:thiamine monophosphate synthase